MSKDILINGFPAYHSYPNNKVGHPALIVIHEIWGLTDHVKDVANRFTSEGYSVLAPNLFHGMSFEGKIDHSLLEEMRNPETRDEAQKKMRALMAPIREPQFAEAALIKLKECIDYLINDEHVNGEVGVTGFCFGGTYAF